MNSSDAPLSTTTKKVKKPAQSTKDAFAGIAPLYDELMLDVPYDKWVVYLKQLLEERNAKPRHILDLACGTGNMAELLTGEGYAVTGVDIASAMIQEAKRKAEEKKLSIDYYVQDAAELDLPGRKFDLCVSLFDSLNYITHPQRLAEAILRVSLYLTRNGLFIFDMNTEFALINKFFDQTNMSTEDRLRYEWESEYFPENRLCKVKMKFLYKEDEGVERVFEEEHWQYAYRSDEIEIMLQNAGFDDITLYQAYTLRPPNRSSDRIYYVARKV